MGGEGQKEIERRKEGRRERNWKKGKKELEQENKGIRSGKRGIGAGKSRN